MRHKFNAVMTFRDGHKFASKAEAHRYDELNLLKRNGDVVFFLRQVPFHLPGGGSWKCDFMVFWKSERVTIEDVKGYDTAEAKRIRKIIESIYPITIDIIRYG